MYIKFEVEFIFFGCFMISMGYFKGFFYIDQVRRDFLEERGFEVDLGWEWFVQDGQEEEKCGSGKYQVFLEDNELFIFQSRN